MTYKDRLYKLEVALLSLVVFMLPMHKRIVPLSIVLFCLVFLINGGLKRMLESFKHRYVWITTSYYLFLLLGMIYTDNISAGWFDLEVKFSLFLFPVVIPALKINEKQLGSIFFWFIMGCLLASIICIMTAVFYYFDSSDVSVFYYQQLSVFQHPSYFSMYINFCIYIIYYYMVFNKESFIIRSDVLSVTIIVIFSLLVVLLSSKIGLITLFMVIFTGTLLWFLKSRAIFPSIMVFLMLSTLIHFSFRYSNQIQGRVQEAVNSLTSEKVTFTTTGARLAIWSSGYDLFVEKPLLGYGTGDVKSELVQQYDKKGFAHLAQFQLNAHNQFLQMLIAIGLLGSIFFLSYLFYPVFVKDFFKNSVYIGFLGLTVVNFLPESMLETQAGVVYYALFNSLLFFNMDKSKPLKIKYP